MKYLSGNEEKKALEYIEKAAKIALNSTCERAHCGCVIVQNDKIIGSGFNSPPQNNIKPKTNKKTPRLRRGCFNL